jgi:hypothetical protein
VLAAYALLFLAGFCSSAFRILTTAQLLEVVPNEVMGRTSATLLLVSMLLQVGVTLGIGPLIDAGSASGGFLMLAAIVAAGLALQAASAPSLRRAPVRGAESA